MGKGAGLVLPRCTTEAMNAHLQQISLAVARRAHALLLLDGAGWHTAAMRRRNTRAHYMTC